MNSSSVTVRQRGVGLRCRPDIGQQRSCCGDQLNPPPLDGIVQLMERRRIKRVPVMEGDALVGIVSRADLLRALALVLEKQSGEIPSDEEILEQIHAELAKVAWVPRDGLSITVKDGVLDLDGVILEEREREALRVVAENVASVKAVEDHLVWIEPVSGIVIDPRQGERGSS